MIDFNQIKSTYRIEDVIGPHLAGGLKRQGSQWVGNCPFHDDHHASLKISDSKNIFKCFVSDCGKGGDMFDFFELQGKTKKEAAAIITGGSIIPMSEAKPKPVEKKWINAIPSTVPNPLQLQHPRYSTHPVAAWPYHNAAGNIIGFTCRFDLPEGKKDVLPYSFKQQVSAEGMPQGQPVWRWSELDKPRPLYNLPEIIARPKAIILMVEGEKTADAAKLLYPQYVVTTWIGGADNVKYTDWSPLKDRNIFMWPDNDTAGLHAMFGGWALNDITKEYKRVTGICELFEANFKWVKNERSFPKKWDVADATWNQDEAKEYLLSHREAIPVVSANPPNELPISENSAPAVPEIPKIPPKSTAAPDTFINQYFKCLGFESKNDQNLYVFFVNRTNVIVKLSASAITTANLIQLAPLNYWEGNFPKATKSAGVKFDVNNIANVLITESSKMGFFDPNKIRGRGAWKDKNSIVIHCGDSLIVDGVTKSFSEHKSKYIYEAGRELGFTLTEPLTKTEANKLIQIVKRLHWARPVDAYLVSGWIVIAAMCGALNWRSHLWMTGAAGTGKSWIMKNLIKRLLGEMCIDAQGTTTEAGIRQYLRSDALPVVFDEAESEDKKSSERIQSILELMRASSTSDSGKIIKGSAGGSAYQFDIRSCFAFSSIANEITQRSDFSRITTVELKKDLSPDRRQKWEETRNLYGQTMNDAYVQKFQSRAITLLPVILTNAATFSSAADAVLDNQRTGDQLGALLAGAYSLTSSDLISFEAAKAWILEREWTEERLSESTRDEIKVINKIMDAETNVETMYGKVMRTIGELVIIARGDVVNSHDAATISEELAGSTLRRLGIKMEGYSIVFSDNSAFISKALGGTAYSKNYHTLISRLDGAEKLQPTTFASGIKSRAVKVDTRIIFGDYQNPGMSQTTAEIYASKNEDLNLFEKK